MEVITKKKPKMFKEKYYEKSVKIYGNITVACAINSSFHVLGLWDLIKHHFYDYSLGDYVDYAGNNMASAEFKPNGISFSDEFMNEVLTDRFIRLIFKFFQYYLVRLPALRGITLKPSGSRFSKKEIKDIAKASFNILSEKFPSDIQTFRVTNEFSDFSQLIDARMILGQFINNYIDNKIYRYDWLIEFFKKEYPEKMHNSNINDLAYSVVCDSFSIYYDAFQKAIKRELFYTVNLGSITGTAYLNKI
jgi:hypothetical protein